LGASSSPAAITVVETHTSSTLDGSASTNATVIPF
jgi:hypothetical protein